MRLSVTIGLLLLVTGGAAMAAGGGRQDEDPTDLKTGFETRRGSAWTSLREEQSFLRKLDAASDRVTVSEIGRSVRNRPIQLVTIGPARSRRKIAQGSSMLFVCAQHGTEPAGREGCLQAARDAARGTALTLLVIPTANPDGLATDSRANAQGIDVNRDHSELATPEARAVAAVIRDYRPDLVGDFHEYREAGASRVLLSNAAELHLDVDPGIVQVSSQLTKIVVRALGVKRFETGLYPTLTPEADDSVLRQRAALRHAPSLLVETPRRGTLSALRRVAAHRAAMRAMADMLEDQSNGLARTTAAARSNAVAEGAGGNQRYYYTSPTSYSDTPPCAYKLTEEDHRGVEARLRLHEISSTFTVRSWTVSTAQASQPTIGLLLDERSPRALSPSEPVAC